MKKGFLELAVYGIASILSGTLFFFGIMYPDYLYTEETYRIEWESGLEDVWGMDCETFDGLSDQEKVRMLCELDNSHVRYKSKIWETIRSF